MIEEIRMENKSPKGISSYTGGFFPEIGLRIKLVYKLMVDRRVNFFLKLLPVAAIVYWIVPDIAPGPIDDALILWLGSYLFVELCPDEVVDEHMKKLRHVVFSADVPTPPTQEAPKVDFIDAEFTDVEEKK
jgi:hypothetical protein